MKVNTDNHRTIQVSFRLPKDLVERLRTTAADNERHWPPGPSQTEIVSRGIQQVLAELGKRKQRV
jgi:hypothetical protein